MAEERPGSRDDAAARQAHRQALNELLGLLPEATERDLAYREGVRVGFRTGWAACARFLLGRWRATERLLRDMVGTVWPGGR